MTTDSDANEDEEDQTHSEDGFESARNEPGTADHSQQENQNVSPGPLGKNQRNAADGQTKGLLASIPGLSVGTHAIGTEDPQDGVVAPPPEPKLGKIRSLPGAQASSEHNNIIEKPGYLPYLEDPVPYGPQHDPLLNKTRLVEVRQQPNLAVEFEVEPLHAPSEAVLVPGAYPLGPEGLQPQWPVDHDQETDATAETQQNATIEEIPETMEQINSTAASSNNAAALVEALPVVEDPTPEDRLEAQPMDIHQQSSNEAKDTRLKIFAMGCVGVACIALAISLALGVGNKKGSNAIHDASTPTLSTKMSLPPMENLESLYSSLPETTKESLLNNSTPQYSAWEWLSNHPNISNLEEWRKKQTFALATFYYAMEGPHWPEDVRSKWMNENISECSWVLSDEDVVYWTQESYEILGAAYSEEDYQPCNEKGEIQTICLPRVWFPRRQVVQPSVPPEIGMLTSLKILGIIFSQMKAKLSDIMVPELVGLPGIEQLNLQAGGLSGTLPKQISQLSTLRHLALGANKLSGTIPSELGELTALEYLLAGGDEELVGTIPTELGYLTSMTSFFLYVTSVTGSIPSELGLMTSLELLDLSLNALTGPIPSELGMMASSTTLYVWGNLLTGPMPSELGFCTSMKDLSLDNNNLTGVIPSDLGMMTAITGMFLGNDVNLQRAHNCFTGSIPSELWQLSHLEGLWLQNLPLLIGSVPRNLFMPNLTDLRIEGSPHFAGSLQDYMCTIETLEFDCTGLLCGCDCLCIDKVEDADTQFDDKNQSLS